MNPAAEAAAAAGEPLFDEKTGLARFCVDGRRHPCPIHWPAEDPPAEQLELPLRGIPKHRR